jgi:50S ribosomal subunit-associated GTPase HflX
LSHPRVDEHIEAVNAVTKEIGAFGKQTLMVFNKVDAVAHPGSRRIVQGAFPTQCRDLRAHRRRGERPRRSAPGGDQLWRLNLRFRVRSRIVVDREVHRIGRVHEGSLRR